MIPFSPPYIRQEAIDEVVDTLKSGWITTGPKTKIFEKKISEYCNVEATLCVASATFGLELILRWFGVKPGDEVIIPAYTYCATANVIVHTGAKPVMVDINTDYNISITNIRNAITERTKVIIPVDIAGLPCYYDKIYEIAKNNSLFIPETENQKKLGRILLLSDSAHSFGAVYKGQKSGRFADISVFSFHAVKNLTTAEGGAICLNLPESFDNKSLYNELNILSLHGQSKDALAKTKIGGWRYDVITAGYKGNMTDIQASLGLIALKYYDSEILPRRKEIFNYYTNAFKGYNWAETPVYNDDLRISSYHIYLFKVRKVTENQRDKIIDEIYKQNVSVNVHFQPLPLLSFYKNMGYDINDYPIAYNNYSRTITLPVNEVITDEQLELVVKAVINAVNKVLG
ncbi:MAG: DegT/DnrJ/EryC1/StrS family aminotransferase [Marinilabiliales bacterium]